MWRLGFGLQNKGACLLDVVAQVRPKLITLPINLSFFPRVLIMLFHRERKGKGKGKEKWFSFPACVHCKISKILHLEKLQTQIFYKLLANWTSMENYFCTFSICFFSLNPVFSQELLEWTLMFISFPVRN